MEYIYGALLLHKLGKPVDAEHLHKVIKATGVEPDESKIKALVASLHGVDIAKELENASTAVAVSAHAGPTEAKKEEKKEEEKPVESAAGLASLFG